MQCPRRQVAMDLTLVSFVLLHIRFVEIAVCLRSSCLGIRYFLAVVLLGCFSAWSLSQPQVLQRHLMAKSFVLVAFAAMGCAAGESGDSTLPASCLC